MTVKEAIIKIKNREVFLQKMDFAEFVFIFLILNPKYIIDRHSTKTEDVKKDELLDVILMDVNREKLATISNFYIFSLRPVLRKIIHILVLEVNFTMRINQEIQYYYDQTLKEIRHFLKLEKKFLHYNA